MVPGVRIKEAEGFAPRGRVDYLVYAWQRKWILWACFVEAHIVNTHPPFPALLSYKDGIGQPLWVVYFPDESGGRQFCYLFTDGPALFLVEATQALIHRLGG